MDGTNGTTRLTRVDATLGGTSLLVSGVFTNLPGPGHDVALKVDVNGGRVEDLLRLAINTPQPVATGGLSLAATFLVPPGPGIARERLQIAGTFALASAHFSDPQVQAMLLELSRRGQGKNQKEIAGSVVAASVYGRFRLQRGVVTMPSVTFGVPGVSIVLEGTYATGSEEVHFTGTARLKASLSKVVGGFKSVFIRPFNRLFSEPGSGSVIPIVITGTRSQPQFAVRKGDIFKKGK